MSKRTIENCSVIKSGIEEGYDKPLREVVGDKEYCQGYVKVESDDQPYFKCMNCHLNIFYVK